MISVYMLAAAVVTRAAAVELRPSFTFAYAIDGQVRVRRLQDPASEEALQPPRPLSLHLSLPARKVNGVALAQLRDGHGRSMRVVVAALEDGTLAGLQALPGTRQNKTRADASTTGAGCTGAFAGTCHLGEHLAGTAIKSVVPVAGDTGTASRLLRAPRRCSCCGGWSWIPHSTTKATKVPGRCGDPSRWAQCLAAGLHMPATPAMTLAAAAAAAEVAVWLWVAAMAKAAAELVV